MADNEHPDQQVRDATSVAVLLATVTAVAGCVALGVTVHGAWYAMAVTALIVGVSLAPRHGPGHPERWVPSEQVSQAIGLGAIPTSVALSLADGDWWWLAGGVLVMLLAAVVDNELGKPKAAGR